jgi:hypothetical protein
MYRVAAAGRAAATRCAVAGRTTAQRRCVRCVRQRQAAAGYAATVGASHRGGAVPRRRQSRWQPSSKQLACAARRASRCERRGGDARRASESGQLRCQSLPVEPASVHTYSCGARRAGERTAALPVKLASKQLATLHVKPSSEQVSCAARRASERTAALRASSSAG